MEIGSCLVSILKRHNIKVLFTIPGSLLDLLHDFSCEHNIEIFTATHEEQLGYMAMGYYHSTGIIPVILVTQGPGITDLMTPICCAWRDRVPMIIITSLPSDYEFQDFQDTSGKFSAPNIFQVVKPVTEYQFRLSKESVNSDLNELDKLLSLSKVKRPIYVELDNKILKENIEYKSDEYKLVKENVNWEDLIKETNVGERTVFLVGFGAKNMDIPSFISYVQSIGAKIATTLRAIELIPSDTVGLIGNIGFYGKDRANKYVSNDCENIVSIGASFNRFTLAKWYKTFHSRNAKVLNINNLHFPNVNNVFCDISSIRFVKSIEIKKKNKEIYNSLYAEFNALQKDITYCIESFKESFFNEFILKQGDKIIATPSYGPLGCSVSLAIGSALCYNDSVHVVFCGDGGFMFSGLNLILLKKYQLPIFVIILINEEFKTVADAQRMKFGKTICTSLSLPDFDSFNSFYGIESSICNSKDEIAESFKSFLKLNKPFVVFAKDDLL